MPDYQLGKIYKIVSNVTGDVYIGSTTKKYLSQRLAMHKYNYKKYLNGEHHYVTSFKIIESGDYDMVLFENCPCNSKEELHARERFHIENNKCVNKYIPCRTIKQYRQENREKIAEKNKQYYEENKEQLLEKLQQYREQNRDKLNKKQSEVIQCPLCNGNISRRNLAQHQRSLKCQNARQI